VVTGRLAAPGREVPWEFALARLSPAVDEGWKAADWRDEVLVRHQIPVTIGEDGTFRATDVPPGEWRIDGIVFLPSAAGAGKLRTAGHIPKRFTVAAEPATAAAPAKPVDLGEVPVSFTTHLKAGDPAPDFDVTTLDGKRLRLADLRGKYVVLDFWATWCGSCLHEMPALKRSWETLKEDPDVLFIGMSIDDTDEPVRPLVAERGFGWTQVVLGEDSSVERDYGIEFVPQVWLVLPDGKLESAFAATAAKQIELHRAKAATQPATGG
jgi:peroxiredoxin